MFKLEILFKIYLVLVLIGITQARKYDVEAEAIKLYGEDLRSVLNRFRKTPDYLKILNDKVPDLVTHLRDVGVYTMHHYLIKMKHKIGEILGVDKVDQGSSTPGAGRDQSYYRSNDFGRRQSTGSEEHKDSPVERLDNYEALHSVLTVSEKNAFRDLGYEYAGHIIHSIIKSLGSEDTPEGSTRHTFGPDHKPTTAEHSHVHEVTTTPLEPGSTVGEESTPEALKYKYKVTKHLSHHPIK